SRPAKASEVMAGPWGQGLSRPTSFALQSIVAWGTFVKRGLRRRPHRPARLARENSPCLWLSTLANTSPFRPPPRTASKALEIQACPEGSIRGFWPRPPSATFCVHLLRDGRSAVAWPRFTVGIVPHGSSGEDLGEIVGGNTLRVTVAV